MNRKFTFCIAALFISLAIQAQPPKKVTLGLKGGLNRSEIAGRETNGAKTGYTGGEVYGTFFTEIRLKQPWSLESGLLFSFTDDYHFIEIPLLLKYRLAKRLTGMAGPKMEIVPDPDEAGFYKFTRPGFSAEAGLQFDITRKLVAELRYARGFTRMVNDYALDINNGRRNTWRLGVGVRF